MDARGRPIDFRRLALTVLAAALLGACARSVPAPVEYRPVFGAEQVARQQLPAPAQPEAEPATPAPSRVLAAAPSREVVPRQRPAAVVPSPPKPPTAAGAPSRAAVPVPFAGPPLPQPKPGLQVAAAITDKQLALVPPPRQQSLFAWPISGRLISGFGPKPGGLRNDGINIAAAEGTPVKAAETGVVAYVGNELRGFGNLVLLRHEDGWMTAYAHVEQVQVARGELVQRGQILARVGRSGQVNEPQLHFEIRKGRGAVDPIPHLAPDDGRPDRAVSRAAPPAGRPGPG